MQGQGVPFSTSDDALGLRSPPQTPLQEQQPKLFDIEFDGVEGLLGLTGNAVESTGTYLGGEAAMDVGGEASSGLEGMDWVASAPSTTESFDAPSFPVAGPSRPSTATTATSAAPPFYAATTLPDWLDPMLLGSPSPPFPPRADAQATEKPLALLHSHAFQWSSSPLQGPPASTSSGKKPAAPSARPKSAKVPSEPPKKRHYTPARPFTAEEETALLELAKKHGRKWATIGRDLALRGFPERPSPSLSAKHDALLMAEKAGAAGSGAAGAASEGWKSEDDAKLLHLAATFDQASTTGTATTIDWTTALPFFPGRTTAQLRRRLSNLKVKQKKAKQKEESERLTKAALEAFQAGTAGTSPSSSATQPPFSLPAVPIVIAGLPASTSLALPPPAPSTTSSSSAFPPPRLSFTFQGQPISSIAPTPGGRKSSFAAILNPSTREEEPLPPSSSTATSLAASAASFPRPVLAPSIYAPPATPTARAPPHPLLPATSPSASPLKVATRALPSLRPVVAEATPQALPLRSAVDAAASPVIVAAIPSASQLPPPSPAVAAVPAPPPSPPPHPWSTSLLPIRLTDPPRYPPQPHRPYPFKWPVGTMRSNFERIRREIDEKGWKEGEWPYDEE